MEKLKKLLKTVPTGFLADSRHLAACGFSGDAVRGYVRQGWLERIVRDVYRRPTPVGGPDVIDWKTCILSLQRVMKRDVHLGGTSALYHRGIVHYLFLHGNPTTWIYGEDIPAWSTLVSLDSPVRKRRRNLFADPELGILDDEDPAGKLPWDWEMRRSKPERAFLEAFDELPRYQDFDNLDKLFESFDEPDMRLLKDLLKACTKVNVKRLFFFYADRHDYFEWHSRIDPADFDLGTGDRVVHRDLDAKMHPRYRITVPEIFLRRDDLECPF